MTALNGSPAQTGIEAVDDAQLVRRVQACDEAAFELLMRRHNRRLYRLARSILRNSADAEEALQEAYLAAFQAIGHFRGDASLATWLSRIVANECLGRLRRQTRRHNIVPILSGAGDGHEGKEPFVMPSNDIEGPDRALGRAELRGLLERRIDELPDAFRAVFVMRCVEELSVQETAQCLNIAEATVRSRHFRARSMLRESLAQDMDMAERDVFSFDGGRCDRIVAQVLAQVRGSP
ncbi:MAG: polymerase, sigma-24 subunit, subfamily [Polaromonas sp.]|nr:polymerase, sigma-24 subunit, subfamily [Polaromonas sp.]